MAKHIKTDFDPNEVTLWGVWRPGHFQVYTSRPPALNSANSFLSSRLYEQIPGQGWVLRAERLRDHPSDDCEACGAPVAASYGHRFGYCSRYQWKRKNGKISSPPELLYVCSFCFEAMAR